MVATAFPSLTRRTGGIALAVLALAGCATPPDGKLPESYWQCPGGCAPAVAANAPIEDVRRVPEDNYVPVRGLNGWEGEISGQPVAGGKFARVLIGMRPSEVATLLGPPSDYGNYITAGRTHDHLRYFGSDYSRYEMVYAGSGRLVFSTRSAFGPGRYLTWIVHGQ